MKTPNDKHRTPAAGGFTLIEILAAVSVLAILVLVMGQIVGLVSDTWRAGKARVDNFTQARVALGLIDRDMQLMVLRPDVGAFKDTSGTLGACAFYTRVMGGDGDRKLSLVEYYLDNTGGAPKLMRADYGLNYDSDPATSRVPTFGSPDSLPDMDKTTAQEIADGVVAFDWQFIDANGDLQDDYAFDYDDPDAAANTRAVTISLLVLDKEAYKIAQNSGTLALLLGKIAGTPATNESYADYWKGVLDSPAFADGLPQPVVRSARVFKRSVTLPLTP